MALVAADRVAARQARNGGGRHRRRARHAEGTAPRLRRRQRRGKRADGDDPEVARSRQAGDDRDLSAGRRPRRGRPGPPCLAKLASAVTVAIGIDHWLESQLAHDLPIAPASANFDGLASKHRRAPSLHPQQWRSLFRRLSPPEPLTPNAKKHQWLHAEQLFRSAFHRKAVFPSLVAGMQYGAVCHHLSTHHNYTPRS